jgi:hypothetical protein
LKRRRKNGNRQKKYVVFTSFIPDLNRAGLCGEYLTSYIPDLDRVCLCGEDKAIQRNHLIVTKREEQVFQGLGQKIAILSVVERASD